VRDKFVWAQKKTGDCMGVTARDFNNRAHGIAATIQSKFTSHEVVDDGVLTDRVRSKLGRIVSHPGAIEVTAENGKVTLSGPILEAEVDNVLSCLKWVSGVNEITNNLEVHKEAGNHPALQGGRERQGHQFEFLQENWSPAARVVAGVAGASLATYGGIRRDAIGAGIGAAGLLLLTRGITNIDFTRLAGLAADDGQKTDADKRSPNQAASSMENLFSQSSATI
jgi:hypothetical protein